MATPISGALSYVQYGKEAVAYGTEAATINSAFGNELSINPTPNQEIRRIYGLGNRNAQATIVGKFMGELSLDFTLGTSHWIAAVLGSSASTSSAPYIHTYSEANTLPSLTIENGMDLDTDSVRKYLGCLINEMSMSARLGEQVRCSLGVLYKTESEGTTLDGTPASDSEVPMTFAQGSLECPDGTTISLVDNFTLSARNNSSLVYGIGSRFGQKPIHGQREYEISIQSTYDQAVDFLEKFYGGGTGPVATPAETETLQLNFTNGLTGSNERHIYVDLANLRVANHNLPQAMDNSAIMESITLIARSCSIVGEDNTGTTIFD